jgi:hypothetical protein
VAWRKGRCEKRLAGKVLLANIKIDRDRLIAEVNSNRRAKRIRRLIESRLGLNAKYKTTVIEPIESQFQARWKAALGGARYEANDPEGSDVLPIDAPEVCAMMEKTAKEHWEAWFDLPVPALNDLTPREAAKTEEGRELLESLLLLYGNRAAVSSHNVFRADVVALRRVWE